MPLLLLLTSFTYTNVVSIAEFEQIKSAWNSPEICSTKEIGFTKDIFLGVWRFF